MTVRSETGFFLRGDLSDCGGVAVETCGGEMPQCYGSDAKYDGPGDVEQRPKEAAVPQEVEGLQAE